MDRIQRTSVQQPIAGAANNAAPERPVVLIVTGDESLRQVAARVVAREGYTVVTAAHAGHAVLACLEIGRVDVVAAELSMEDTSGPALTTCLRRHCPEMAAVYFAQTGGTDCNHVLVRPFTSDDLLAALASARAAVHLSPLTTSAS